MALLEAAGGSGYDAVHDAGEREAVLQACLRRVLRWHIPPNYSRSDWREEMHSLCTVALYTALNEFDSEQGVPCSAFLHRRIVASAWTRYRQEWAYANRLHRPKTEDDAMTLLEAIPDRNRDWEAIFDLRRQVHRLCSADHDLLIAYYIEGKTLVEIARGRRVSHQAISKRLRRVELQLLSDNRENFFE